MAESITVQMNKIIDEYSEEVERATKNALNSVANEAASMLRSTSPKGKKGYAGGWRVKKLDAKTAVVHNGKFPGLTHLLENGHAVVNQYGNTGKRARAIKHIKPVETWAQEEFPARIMRELP